MTASDGATSRGTRGFALRAVERHGVSPGHFRVTRSGLTLSSVGLGTYLGAADGPTDLAVEQAVSICLSSRRVNVLDTAINYRHQRAERSVGRALRRLFEGGDVAREEVFLSTKIGYLAPDAEAGISPAAWVERELLGPGVVRPEDLVDGSHSMSRSYLTDQLGRSLRNLDLGTVDLLYLHNGPEAQLSAVGLETFLVRLEEAFGLFESFREEGKIVSYGLATWQSLRTPPGRPGHFPLEAALARARKVGGEEHGLRFVQFPFNAAMPEAWAVPTQSVGGERLPLFRAAQKLGLGCFTSVPLLQGELARGGRSRSGLSAAQTALQFARSAPGTLTTLVGQKTPQHLSENLELAQRLPWDDAEFGEAAV